MKRILLVALICVGGVEPLIGQTVYTLTGNFSSSTIPGYIAIGDPFKVSFTLDLSAVDSTSPVNSGGNTETFGAIGNLSFELTSGATGTYTGGTSAANFSLNDNIAGNDYASVATKASPAPAFPSAGTAAFYQLQIDLTYLNSNFITLVPATGQSLGTVLTSPLNMGDFSQAKIALFFDGLNQEARGTIDSIQVAAVPEPSVYAFALSVIVFGIAAIRRRNDRSITAREKSGTTPTKAP